jgi:hypothetical protein
MRYENVDFDFLSAAGPPETLRGTVVVRDAEMVLEVECPDEPRPYTIPAKATHNVFHGRHVGLPDDVPVEAKWTQLDDIFIGTWIEHGIDYVFTFRLPDAEV